MSGRGAFVRRGSVLTRKTRLLLGLYVMLALLCMLCIWGFHAVTNALPTQSAAAAWRGDNEMRFAQVSVFLPEDEKTQLQTVELFRQSLQQTMTDASVVAPEGGSLFTDAYSGTATVTVTGEKSTVNVKTIGVGGEFFLFHPLQLRSGSYLSERDYMQDRVLLDEELAWALFGSLDVAGMSVLIGERPYPVAGVVRREDDFASRAAYQDGAGMFMSYDALNAMEPTKISCYEVVMHDMVSGYAESVVREKFPVGDGTVVENTGRYGLPALAKVLGSYGKRSMNTQGIIYPYWENAARMTEDYAAVLALFAMLFGAAPLIVAALFALRALRRGAKKARDAAADRLEAAIEAKKEKHYIRKGL